IVIDFMLGDLITCSGCSPMSINGHPNVLLFHHRPPFGSACLRHQRLVASNQGAAKRWLRKEPGRRAFSTSLLSCELGQDYLWKDSLTLMCIARQPGSDGPGAASNRYDFSAAARVVACFFISFSDTSLTWVATCHRWPKGSSSDALRSP